jgi:hypothetical protein
MTTTDDTVASLQEEILHLKRSVGFHRMMASQARADVLGRIHRALDHRLDNIRGYADRPNPNGQEILALVQEISTKLQEISINE